MAPSYLNFDLLIEGSEQEGYRALVLNSPAGEATADFSLPLGVHPLESPHMEAAKKFGGDLFEAVFSDQVRDCLRLSLNEAERLGVGLRIRLRLADTPELAGLPWEYLYDPAHNHFFSVSKETPLVRYLPLPQDVRPLAVRPPLRVLVMIVSPRDYPPLDVEREWAVLKEAVANLVQSELVTLERLEGATREALQRQLRRGAYHIFHFIGHGGFDEETQDGVLILEDEQRGACPLSGQHLGALLHDERTLSLAILNACESARTARGDPFAGLAQRLVHRGVPAVIAMQCEIADQSAVAFTREFYSALADGDPVDAALAEARKAIFSDENVEWGTPVLYMRARDGRIFDMEKDAPVVEKPVAYQEPKLAEAARMAPGVRERVDVSRRRRLWLRIGVMAVLLIAGAVAFFIMGTMGNNNNTPTVSPAVSLPVVTSVNMPTPTKTRVLPTDTLTPIPTGTSTPTPTPLICQDSVEPEFSERYEATDLGCPRSEGVKGKKSDQRFAQQKFESGWMFWRKDRGGIIYVLYDNGRRWERFQDPYIEGQIDIDCQPPEDRFRPDHGFGMIWRDEVGKGDCAKAIETIGWGMQREDNVGALVQEFDAGVMIMLNPDQDPELFLLYTSDTDLYSGRWTQ